MTVLVLFGGVTTEHDVSVVTAAQAMAVMDDIKVVPVYIDRKGVWRYDRRFLTIEGIHGHRGKRVHLRPKTPYLYRNGRRVCKIDAVLNCMHGLHGEDGSVAVWAETAGVPYTGSGSAGSSVGMDKILTKYFLRGAGLPVVPGIAVKRGDDAVAMLAAASIDFPVVVKPARLGSSIGIKMAHGADELDEAIEVAFCYDERVLIEKGITDRKEYNCAAIGRADQVTVGEVEEVGGMDEVLSFADKYLRGGKVGGMENLARRVPAEMPIKQTMKIEAMTEKIFNALDLSGVVRVDFLYDATDRKLYVNEINIVPGSLAYYLFPTMGMRGVIERLLKTAKDRFFESEKRVTDFRQELAHGKDQTHN